MHGLDTSNVSSRVESRRVESSQVEFGLNRRSGVALTMHHRLYGWWRGSVVRTSDFVLWTFPDLHLIYGWHVTTSWVKCPLEVNQPGSELTLNSERHSPKTLLEPGDGGVGVFQATSCSTASPPSLNQLSRVAQFLPSDHTLCQKTQFDIVK